MPHRRHSPYFRKILVGYDGSVQSKKAVEVALSLAQSLDSKVLLFAVARPPEPATSVELDAVLDDARQHFEQDFNQILARAPDLGIEITADMAVGHPAEQIVHKAEMEHADLIILGRRGTSLFEKWLLGSVSERVLRYAHCPVMVIR